MGQADPKKLFLGKLYDQNNKISDTKALYDPSDLNTHCVITGMTGSGKTGLGILMLEEIALKNIPAIVIDPKGDLTNLLLHFPNMTGKDVAPWLDPEAPARAGKDLETLSDEIAKKWIAGQDSWGLTQDDVAALSNVEYTLFTPGSNAGNPVNIMTSFAAPEKSWAAGDESIREEISTSVSALLGLVGFTNIDPIQSKEHILLSNIIEYFWSKGENVSLIDMIQAINEPPFETLGALSVEDIYPKKERKALALLINNFLASPSFQKWNTGPGLDIDALTNNSDGKPRVNIFTIQHLSDKERMFFVTMLYSQIESWMRKQQGTGNLRLAVYMDEVAGYLPPVQNPSSRPVILRLLKQARAFGVGLILATQNPIDIDYKALSNTGTWFVGRLQTEQDKNRLIDGLSTTEGEINRSEADKLISALEKRSFLYMNIHEPGLKVMTTRWTLNYLAGPLTSRSIGKLKEYGLYTPMETNAADRQNAELLTKNKIVQAASKEDPDKVKEGGRPSIPATINEYFMRSSKTAEECGMAADSPVTYVPSWIAQAEIHVSQRKFNLNTSIEKAALIEEENVKGTSIRWEDYAIDPLDRNQLDNKQEFENATFSPLQDWMKDEKAAKRYASDFTDYIYHDSDIVIQGNEKLDVYADSSVSKEQFTAMCKEKIDEAMEAEKEKLSKAHETDLDKFESKMKKLQITISEKEAMVKSRNIEKIGAYGELALSLLTGRRKSVSSSLSKTGQSETAQKALDKAMLDMDELKEDVKQSIDEYNQDIEKLQEKWNKIAESTEEIKVNVMKKDIETSAFGILWTPYYTDSTGKQVAAC